VFLRQKRSGNYVHVVLVENKRVGGRVVQNTIARLGRYSDLLASGALLSIANSATKLAQIAPDATRKQARRLARALRPNGSAVQKRQR